MPRIAWTAIIAALVALPVPGGAQPSGLDRWLADLDRLPLGIRAARVEARVAEHGGTPLIDGDEVLFLVQASSGRAPRVVGDFNFWGNEGDSYNPRAGLMRRIEGTTWYALRTTLRADARIEYLLDLGGAELEPDPRNPRQVFSFHKPNSELAMPGHATPPEVADALAGGDPASGVTRHRVTSRVLGNTRDVAVYVPPGARHEGMRYPVVYFGDGADWIGQGLAPRLIDALLARGAIRPVIAVFVDPVNRRDEYSLSDAYRRFFADELLPFVETRYPIDRRRESRAVVGSSRGALAAFDLVFRRDDLFAFGGLLSPATQPHDMTAVVTGVRPKPVAFFILAGIYDRRWLPDARHLHDALRRAGYPVTYREVAQGHSFPAWRESLGEVLRAFAPP